MNSQGGSSHKGYSSLYGALNLYPGRGPITLGFSSSLLGCSGECFARNARACFGVFFTL